MEKVSLVSAMGDPSARPAHGPRGVLEVEDGADDLLSARRRSGTPPRGLPGMAMPKPVSKIFAPPRLYQARGAGDQARLGVTVPCVGEVTSKAAREMVAAWLRNPRNWAVAAWGVAVFVSGAVLFMVMVGMLNGVLPHRADRDLWFEASNQTINALFTLLVLVLHPLRALHLLWALRWRRKDVSKLRQVYCKGTDAKPNERAHLLVVVLLYQLNCFAQYAVCALNWYYRRAERPVAAVVVCFVTALSAGCAAGVYANLSPLGKDTSAPAEDDAGNAKPARSSLLRAPQKYDQLLVAASNLVENPQWQGGLFECWESPSLVAATACCFPCVLGHNLSRLGFGNRYVHVATFLLACFAPYVIFHIAAVNVDSRGFRQFLRASGAIVSVCGLFYGGYWRIRMRETYNLPGETWCCGCPTLSDFTQWLLCSCCSVCQEVRTAEAFDISNNRFYVKASASDNGSIVLAQDPGYSDVFPPSSLQPLPVSSVVRITEIALSNIRDATVLDPPANQNVFHSNGARQ